MPLEKGERLLVRYLKTRKFYHERAVLKHLTASWYLFVTPDGDVYTEELAAPPAVEVHRGVRTATGRQSTPFWD